MSSFEVVIPTYVNPHLFWIIESKNEENTKALQNLVRDINVKEPDLDISFEVGEIVAVQYKKNYYRAIIEDIKEKGTNNGFTYLCWLIDYGTIYEPETVYKLPAQLRKTKPLAMQASLNNVVYIQQHLSFDEESGQPKKVYEPIVTPTSIAHHVSLELMLKAKALYFTVENKSDGILFGDVLYNVDNETKSLRQGLIDRGVLVVNEILFQEIQGNIYNYKESHLVLIVQICRKLNCHILEETSNKTDCRNIISKYLQEFDNRDLFDDNESLQPVARRRGRGKKNVTSNSSNGLRSGNESTSDADISSKLKDLGLSNASSNNMSVGRNRTKLLLEKLRRHHERSSEVKSDVLTDDDSHQETDNTSNDFKPSPPLSAKQKLAEFLKAKKLELSDKKGKDDSPTSVEKETITSGNQPNLEDYETINQTPTAEPKKRVIPRNAIFQPGGASFTILNSMVTSTPKSHEKKEKTSSSDSDRKTTVVKKPDIVSDDNTTMEDKSDTAAMPSEEPPTAAGRLKIKPHCSCRQCDHWTHDKDWQTRLDFCDDPKEPQHTFAKPQLLFREDEASFNKRCIVSLDYESMTKVQKQAMLKLLVHGEYSPHPMNLVSQACFHSDIHKSLHQLDYKQTKRIQTYSWPGVLRYQHVFIVGGPQTGKTMGYLPIMLTFLLEKNERYGPLLKAGGPIFIVLCANTKKCEDVYDLAKIILGRNRVRVSLITYPITHVNTSHIDFLVTTAPILVDLVKSNAITFKRLCHLILEDGDKILAEPEIAKIFSLTQNMLEHRLHPKPVQLITCAEHWNSRMESLIRQLNKTPLICIGNYLEAALYGKVQFSMRFVNSACKEHELKSLLKDTHKICKSVIICNDKEIEDIKTILMLKGIDATIISEDMSKETILYLEEVWTNCKGGQYTVLVCTDFLLNTLLTVTDASLLIHYSMPVSWTKFVKRFSCLLENCKSPLDIKESKVKCQSVVLCDEECEEHMLKFFRFIDATELKNQLPDKFKKFSKGLKHLEEEKKLKSEVGLCETLKLFSTCRDVNCLRRHILDKNLDVSKHLPDSGKIKFKIVHVQDVTTYSVELIQHIDTNDKVHEFDDIADVTEDLTDAMKISRKRIQTPVVGHLYAYYDMDEMDGVYHRCDLLEIDNECVKIKLIDKGSIINTVKARLYRLPKDFKDTSKPRKIYDAILANLLPPYRDENFSAKSFFNLRNVLEKFDYKNIILTGEVHLQLGNTLWLKSVYQEVVLSDRVVAGLQLSRELLLLKLAVCNNDQLVGLYKLCNDAGIQLPTYEKQSEKERVVKEEAKVEPQWAHLDADEVSEVILSSAISPDEIYFRLNKFNHLLYTLQKEIQECLKKPHYPKLKNVEVGTICLAKDLDGEYSRVVVQKMESDKALCFFVDFGDEAVVNVSELKHIHSKFVTKLPFQTVQCRLHGIKPILDEWQTEVVDILYEYSMEPNTDIFRSLYIKCCGKEENAILAKQNRYSVLLKDGFGEKQSLINNLLVDCGLAIPNPEEDIVDFELPESSIETDESDEGIEKIIDICRKTKEVEENFHSTKTETVNGKTEPSYEDMELFLIKPLEFFEQVILNENYDSKPSGVRELPAIQAAPPVDYCTPEVLWSQTKKNIKIDIKLYDVHQYNLNLTKGRIINFKTVKNDKTYILKLMLYEKVDTIQHTSMGLQIRITLTKSKDIEWPRLILSKQRARNIHYDTSTIEVNETTKKILELPKMSDDEKESDDDEIDMMYEVFSDLDSDLDMEMPQDSD